MDSLNIGLSSWIIRDGNYGDFSVGQKTEFALEFYPHSVQASDCRSPSATHLDKNVYQICAQVVYRTNRLWVLDMGFLAYNEMEPPPFAEKGSWVKGEFSIGIDPFMYFEYLKNRSGMPNLTYRFRIDQIFIETNESYAEVAETNAWGDNNGSANYILKCVSIDGRIR